MSRPTSPILNLDPYSSLYGLFVQHKALVQHLGANTGSSSLHWGKKEHTASVHVPPITGIKVSCGLGIPASMGNLVSDVRAVGNGNMSSVLTV